MDRLPIFLRLTGLRCLVIGGGVVAERKIRLLSRTGADITVLSPELCPGLRAARQSGEFHWLRQPYESSLIGDFRLLVAATDDVELNRRIALDADSAGCLCNVVDDNEASSFILPAIVDRSPVIVAIGTEGNAPVLARQLKAQIEAWIPVRIGHLATQAGRWRELVRKRFATARERRRFWQRFFEGPIASHLLAGRQAEAERAMRNELVGETVQAADAEGEAWIVGAGPGDPGLVTLRAQQLIGTADVVLFDRLVSKPVLDFARKEAELISVGKRAGYSAMPQDAINALLVQLVRDGKRVCRLKGGDPFVFGRGAEEARALAAAGLRFEIVPGITAAMACAAYAGIPLTERGISTSVTLATAQLESGPRPDWARLLHAGDTLAIYMGTTSVARIQERLLQEGIGADTPVAFVENGTTSRQRVIITRIAAMATQAAVSGLSSPAIIYIGKSIAGAEELQWFGNRSQASDFPGHVDQEIVSAVSS